VTWCFSLHGHNERPSRQINKIGVVATAMGIEEDMEERATKN